MVISLSVSRILVFIRKNKDTLQRNSNTEFVDYIFNAFKQKYVNFEYDETQIGSLNRLLAIDFDKFVTANSGTIPISKNLVKSLDRNNYELFLSDIGIKESEYDILVPLDPVRNTIFDSNEPPKVLSKATTTKIFLSSNLLDNYELLAQQLRGEISQHADYVFTSSGYPFATNIVKHGMEIRGEIVRSFLDQTIFANMLIKIKKENQTLTEINNKKTIVGLTGMHIFEWCLDEISGNSFIRRFSNVTFTTLDSVIDTNYGVANDRLLFRAQDVVESIIISDRPELQNYSKLFNDFNVSVSAFNKFRNVRPLLSNWKNLINNTKTGSYYK